MANASVTETIKQYSRSKGIPSVIVADFAFVADDTNAEIPATAFSATLMNLIMGYFLFAMITTPDGVTPPTNGYNITLIGGDTGADLLGGVGAGRSDTNTEQVLPKIATVEVKRLIDETPTLTFAGNSVNSAEGNVRFLFLKDV